MTLNQVKKYMNQKIAEGYKPSGCAAWYVTVFQMLHGADPTPACELANLMTYHHEDMGLSQAEAGDLYVEALQEVATRAFFASWFIYMGWAAIRVSMWRSTDSRRMIRIEQKCDWLIQEEKARQVRENI